MRAAVTWIESCEAKSLAILPMNSRQIQLVINIKTASALGVDVSRDMLSIADEVIEMNRRQVISGLGSAMTWPVLARGQQSAIPVIGFLNSGTASANGPLTAAFHKGLGEQGYSEGRNVAVLYRWADTQYDRLPELAADLVRQRVAVIATGGGVASALAAKAATTTIPIVFQSGGDPVASGLVASLSRPGGNVTGVTYLSNNVLRKRSNFCTQRSQGRKSSAFSSIPHLLSSNLTSPSARRRAGPGRWSQKSSNQLTQWKSNGPSKSSQGMPSTP